MEILNYATLHGGDVIPMNIEAWKIPNDRLVILDKPFITFETIPGIDVIMFNRMLHEIFATLEHIAPNEGYQLTLTIMLDECNAKTGGGVTEGQLIPILDKIFGNGHYEFLQDNKSLILGWATGLKAILLPLPI